MITKIVILVLFACFFLKVHGQAYTKIAVEGAHWVVRFDLMETFNPVDDLWEYYCSGDSMVGDFNFKKIYRRNLVVTQAPPPFQAEDTYQLFGLIRDDTLGKKVWAIRFSEPSPWSQNPCPKNQEYLLYDFSIQIGDTVTLCVLPGSAIVYQIFHENVLGFDTWLYSTNSGAFYEGIGSEYGLFEEMFAPLKRNERYVMRTILSYYCRESPCDLVLSTPNLPELQSFEILPNPAVESIYLKKNINIEINSVALFNILGQKKAQHFGEVNVLNISGLERGMYILEVQSGKNIFRYRIIKI